MSIGTTNRTLSNRGAAMLVSALTAGAIFAAASGARAQAQTAPQQRTVAVAAQPDDGGFTQEEQEQARNLARAFDELGVSEQQFADAMEAALNDAPPAGGLRERLAALPDAPTAEQTAEAAYPGNTRAQKAMLPILANNEVRYTALRDLADRSGEQSPAVAFGWWDETKFYVGCAAAVAGVFISFVPAGSSIKVVRAVALFKKYGAKKTVNIIYRFVRGKHVGSKEREAVKAFIGISAISKACSR
ncbi:hypothetical protein [Streptomyces sp. NPDC055189]